MASRRILDRILTFFRWIGGIGNAPGDSPELKSHKVIIVVSLYASTANLIYFYFEYLKIGRPTAALALLICAIYFTVVLIAFSIHRNYKALRAFAFIGSYFYIIAYIKSAHFHFITA